MFYMHTYVHTHLHTHAHAHARAHVCAFICTISRFFYLLKFHLIFSHCNPLSRLTICNLISSGRNITRPSPSQKLRKVINFVEFCCIYLNFLEFAVFEKHVTDGRTDGRMDGRTDKVSYTVAFHN